MRTYNNYNSTIYLMFVLVSFIVVTYFSCAWCVPSDWEERVRTGNMLFSEEDNIPLSRMAHIGNGYLGTVLNSNATFVAGFFNGISSITPSHRARIPSTVAIKIRVQSPYTLKYIGSALDLEKAIFYKRYQIPSILSLGSLFEIEERWYCHRKYRSVMVYEFSYHFTKVNENRNPSRFVDDNENIQVFLTPMYNLTSEDLNINADKQSDFTAIYGRTRIPETPAVDTIEFAQVTTNIPHNLTLSSSFSIKQNFTFITAIRTGIDVNTRVSSVLKVAIEDYKYAFELKQNLERLHTEEWNKLYQSKLEVELNDNNLDIVQKVNSSFYYLLSSVREDYPWGLPTCSITTNGYNGHIFSDSETWMAPGLLSFHPDIIKNAILGYRYNTIDGAKRKAKSYQNPGPYNGAMYCWECAYTGEETCPLWAPTGKLEQHISGDIGVAIKRQFDYTGDMEWLKEKGFEMLSEISKFWASRVSLNQHSGQYEINQVIDMDERTCEIGSVNNSAYTNVCAKSTLEFTIYAAKLLGKEVPKTFQDIAERMRIPMDDKLMIHLPWDNYNFSSNWGGLPIYMLGYTISDYDIPYEIRKNDIFFYDNRSWYKDAPKGMIFSMLTVSWLEMHTQEALQKANAYFATSQENIKHPFLVPSELDSGGCVGFITTYGGFLQSLLNGYGGLRVDSKKMILTPVLPPNTRKIVMKRFQYLGNMMDIAYDEDQIYIQVVKVSENDLVLRDSTGNIHELSEGRKVTVKRGEIMINKYA